MAAFISLTETAKGFDGLSKRTPFDSGVWEHSKLDLISLATMRD